MKKSLNCEQCIWEIRRLERVVIADYKFHGPDDFVSRNLADVEAPGLAKVLK